MMSQALRRDAEWVISQWPLADSEARKDMLRKEWQELKWRYQSERMCPVRQKPVAEMTDYELGLAIIQGRLPKR